MTCSAPAALRGIVCSAALACAGAGAAAEGPMSSSYQAAASAPALDVNQLFANTCGWCHSSGGREAGKGPQLMNSPLSDDEIVQRIKNGKAGAMPGFGATFSDEQIRAIVKYIRELKPEGGAR